MVEKVTKWYRAPERRDVVVFDPPPIFWDLTSRVPDGEAVIKRVVAVAGDEVRVSQGKLYVNGVAQDEPFTNEAAEYELEPLRVPPECVFVLGDNRNYRSTRTSGLPAGRTSSAVPSSPTAADEAWRRSPPRREARARAAINGSFFAGFEASRGSERDPRWPQFSWRLVAYAPGAVRRRAPGEPLVVAMRTAAGAAPAAGRRRRRAPPLARQHVALVEQPAPAAPQPARCAAARRGSRSPSSRTSRAAARREASLWRACRRVPARR